MSALLRPVNLPAVAKYSLHSFKPLSKVHFSRSKSFCSSELSLQTLTRSVLKLGKFENFRGALSVHFSQQASSLKPKQIDDHGGNFRRSVQFKNPETLQQALTKLDLDARRLGRIHRKDLIFAIDKIKEQGFADSVQSLLVIRGCGSLLFRDNFTERTKMVQSLWSTLKQLNCPLDISHYNALLKVYLENHYKFSPIEFLAEMENKGIEPNRVTYQRLIAGFCQEGDIEGSSQILKFMKAKDLPINEMVFSELVFGHAKSGDMQGAREILEVMRNAKLEPSNLTYTVLAQGYGLQGDLKSILETIEEARKQESSLTDRDILSVITTLALSGHPDKVEELFPLFTKQFGYNQECVRTIMELVNGGHDEVAFKLLQTMPRAITFDGSLAPTGGFFVDQMVQANTPPETILKYCILMKERKMNSQALHRATEVALSSQKPDHALTFIKEFQLQGLPIRAHFFWPILIAKKGSEADIFEILSTMRDCGCPPNFETFTEYVLPFLNTLDPEAIIQKVKSLGQSVGSILSPLVYFYVSQKMVNKAADVLAHYPVALQSTAQIRNLALNFNSDMNSILKVLKHIEDNPDHSTEQISQIDIYGQFLIEYLYTSDFRAPELESVLKAMKQANAHISHDAAETIVSKARNVLGETVRNLLRELSAGDIQGGINQDGSFGLHPRDMKLEDLENHLIELKSKGMNTRGVLRRLFLIHCRKRNFERVKEIKEELDSQNFIYSNAMNAQLLDLVVNEGNLEDALKLKEKLDHTDPDFKLDTFKLLNLGSLLVKEKRSQEAIDLLKKHENKPEFVFDDDFLTNNVFRFLASAADQGNVDLTRKLFELVVVRLELCKPNNIICGPLVKAHIINNDLDGAVTEFEHCAKQFKCTPWKNEIMKKLIELEDSDRLQTIMDLSTEIHGELNILYDLACGFIENDRLKQAKKVMETPGLRANNRRLQSICESFIEKDKLKALEGLVAVTKDLFDIDRSMMYYQLLRAYAKENDVSKAMEVWTAMQEENIQPSPQLLSFLSEFLTKNNQPVPFNYQPKLETSRLQQTLIHPLIKEGDIDKVLQFKKELKSRGGTLSASNESYLINLFIQDQRLEEAITLTKELLERNISPSEKLMRDLFKSLADQGETESLMAFKSYLSEEQQAKYGFRGNLNVATMNKMGAVNFLQSIEDNFPQSQENFTMGCIFSLFGNHEELQDRLKKLCKRFADEANYFAPVTALWMNEYSNGNPEAADEIIVKYPDLRTISFIAFIRRAALARKDVALAQKLVSIVEENKFPEEAKSLAYGCVIELLIKTSSLDEALGTYNKYPGNLHPTVLKRLNYALTSEGKTVPPKLLVQVSNNSEKKDADSSSSNDSSDDEVKR